VRARREALGISRGRFAELCGLTQGALWRVEDGRPKDDELDRVVRALREQETRQ
jgi:predicted transcriptional regulator